MTATAADKLAEARREVAMRRAVYPRQVAAGKMTQAEADARIAVMQAIADDYAVGTVASGETAPATDDGWEPLVSTNLAAMKATSDGTGTFTLRIRFQNGSQYAYESVDEEAVAGLRDADSPGRYFSEFIRGRYEHVKIRAPNVVPLRGHRSPPLVEAGQLDGGGDDSPGDGG